MKGYINHSISDVKRDFNQGYVNLTIASEPTEPEEDIWDEVRSLKFQNKASEKLIEYLKGMLGDVKQELDRSLKENNCFPKPKTPRGNNQVKECKLIQSSVEGSTKLIRQLISTEVNKNSDFGLIKKCNKSTPRR